MAKRGRSGRWLLALGFAVAAFLVAWGAWPEDQDVPPSPQPRPMDASAPAGQTPGHMLDPQDREAEGHTPDTDQPPPAVATEQMPLDPEEALASYRRGRELQETGKLVEARSELCKAYFSGRLPKHLQSQARQILTELAELTLIGRGSGVYPGDHYAGHYQCMAGDSLAKIERAQKLHVPWQLLVKINNMRRPEDLEAGRRYKLVHGPFHAIIYKGKFLMDVFLQREGQEKVFIKRLAIGTGANGSTPTGMWRVQLGGKHERPTWYPPPNSTYRGPIPYGRPGYAFGQKGLWIGLQGLDPVTKPLTDYGIHSTNNPGSIGNAESLGCIRLADENIDLVYSLLYEHWSTVEVRP